MNKLQLLQLEDVFGEKLISIFGNRADLEKQNEIAMDEFHDNLARIRANSFLSRQEKDAEIRKSAIDLNTNLFNNEKEAAEGAAKNLEDTIDIAGKAANAFISLSSQKIDSDIKEAKARGASSKEIEKLERKKFELNKKAQLGNAIINTAANVVEAKPPSPKAIAAGVLGAIQIATILKTKFGGGGGRSSSGGGSGSGASQGVFNTSGGDRQTRMNRPLFAGEATSFVPRAQGGAQGLNVNITNTFDEGTAASVVLAGNEQRREGAVSAI